jgi:glutathione synthase/RimK-type ligase-like ATP-grasp enzyme
MNKIKYLIKRIIGMNYKGFFETINEVHKKNNKNRIFIFFDVIYCGLKYQAGYIDYNLYEMYNMNGSERNTIITRGINNEFIKKYNDPKYMKYFNSKLEFNKKFDKYLNRKWLYLDGSNLKEFQEFCKSHERIIVKPDNASCGKGVELIELKKQNIKKLYNNLIENKQFLVEEVATQCQKINELHPESINTVRVVTLLGSVVVAFLRIGTKDNNVDNFNHDGLVAPIDIETGKINYQAIDKKKNLYTIHPTTQKKIVGLTIPKWQEVKKLCEDASKEIPEVGYVGWDVCVGTSKCFFIEGNEFPGHDLYQLPPHRSSNTGLLPVFKEVLERNKTK